MKLFLFLNFFLLSSSSFAQESSGRKNTEVFFAWMLTNAKYSIGVSYPPGIIETDIPQSGLSLGIIKNFKSQSKMRMQTGVIMGIFRYKNKYSYPDGYNLPRTLQRDYNYLFASLSHRFLYQAVACKKLKAYPYVGLLINFLLKSTVDWKRDYQGYGLSFHQDTTREEDLINYGYEGGIKILMNENRKHPVSIYFSHNHFLRDQFDSGQGKRLYSFNVGCGFIL